jgi:hypothetical protein
MEKFPGQVPFPWFVLAPMGGTEDMWFCLMSRHVGIKIYCDSDLEAAHIGYPEIITGEHGRVWSRKYGSKGLDQVLTETKQSTFIGAVTAEESSAKEGLSGKVDTATVAQESSRELAS